jgi:hypothetical protein
MHAKPITLSGLIPVLPADHDRYHHSLLAKRRQHPRLYRADAEQLRELLACSRRMQRKGSGLVPPSADKGRFANKTTAGGTAPQQPPEPPWSAPAQWEQLPLAPATNPRLAAA